MVLDISLLCPLTPGPSLSFLETTGGGARAASLTPPLLRCSGYELVSWYGRLHTRLVLRRVLAWYHAIHSHISQPFMSYVFLRAWSVFTRLAPHTGAEARERPSEHHARRVCNRPYHETSS